MTDTQKQPKKTRIVASAAMLIAAGGAFSLNQGGLTGRATGGAVGCGGPLEPVAVEAESLARDHSGLQIRPGLATGFDRVRLEIQPMADIQSIVSPDDHLAAQFEARDTFVRPGTLRDRLEYEGYHAFLEYVQKADMMDVFEDVSARVTVFAPSNEAIAQAEGQIAYFLAPENKAMLQALIQAHIAQGRFRFDEAPGHTVETSLVGQPMQIRPDLFEVESSSRITAKVEVANLETDQGMVHGIDRVLIPDPTVPVVALNASYHLFYAMLEAAGKMEMLSNPTEPFSVLAVPDSVLMQEGVSISEVQLPENEAWVKHVVENHVFSGMQAEEFQRTLSGLRVGYDSQEESLLFEDGTVVPVTGGHMSRNGTVYNCDRVLAMSH